MLGLQIVWGQENSSYSGGSLPEAEEIQANWFSVSFIVRDPIEGNAKA